MRVFITGGTGLIGRRLVRRLAERGDRPVVLSRSTSVWRFGDQDVQMVQGDPKEAGDWQAVAADCDAVVNLAGENILSHRWNDEQRRRIRDSRIDATRYVVDALARPEARCKTLVNGSAVGYYGDQGEAMLDEGSPSGSGFLADVTQAWEAEAHRAEGHGCRVVCLRTGMVLDAEGGALASMLPVFRWGLGGRLGSGQQWMPWVHQADIVGLICFALDTADVSGALNGTAPKPSRNRDFTRSLARALKRPAVCCVPRFVIRVGVGDASEVLLASQRVVPAAALSGGYAFAFPDLDEALADLLNQ